MGSHRDMEFNMPHDETSQLLGNHTFPHTRFLNIFSLSHGIMYKYLTSWVNDSHSLVYVVHGKRVVDVYPFYHWDVYMFLID